MDRRSRLATSRLYLVADAAGLRHALDGALRGGADVVQLRDKTADDESLLETAAWAAPRCAEAGALFLLNDRPDLAAAGADGVHVGQDDAAPATARAVVGDDLLVGLSTHSIDEVDRAADEPVDYLGLGPVAPTPTKQGRPGIGLDPVRHAAAAATTPFFVTGGMSPDTAGSVLDAGAHGIVVVRALTEAADPGAVARALRAVLDR